MRTGYIILVRFPFTDLSDTKVRPAVVVCETPDIHKDIIVCMISSVLPIQLNRFKILLQPTSQNGLRTTSVIRIYRIATIASSKIITTLGQLSEFELKNFISTFQSLISE